MKMKIEKIIDGLTDEIEFMIEMGTAPLVQEAARRELQSQQQEIAELKQLAETKNARTLERIGRIEQQEREIAEQKSLAAYAEQRANIAEKTSEALKSKLQSAKADAVDDVYNMIATDVANIEGAGELIGHARVLLSVGEYADEIREGKS